MIIEQKKCDQCGKAYELDENTIEIRKVGGFRCPQIERDAPLPSWELQEGYRKVVTLFSYDFCDLACAKAWIEQSYPSDAFKRCQKPVVK